MGLIVLPDRVLGDVGIEAGIDVELLVAVFQKRNPILLQFLRDIFLLLGKFGFGDVQENQVRRPGIDELHRKGGAVFLGDSVRDIGVQLGAVELAVSYLRHDFVTEKFRCRILDLLHEIAGQGQGENEGQGEEASHRLV